jgi:hypothetical protein
MAKVVFWHDLFGIGRFLMEIRNIWANIKCIFENIHA